MNVRLTRALVALMFAMLPVCTAAHIGSPDVFVETMAGPYRALVTVRPPTVIPGVAEVELFFPDGHVRGVQIVPTPLTGEAARLPPTPDRAVAAPEDSRRFSGRLWLMRAGAWQVRFTVEGEQGSGTAAVPVPALPQATRDMSRGLSVLLFVLMLVLCGGAVAVVSAMAREATLQPGADPSPRDRRRGRVAAAVSTAVVLLMILLGNRWWSAEASAYARYVYKPLTADARVSDGTLRLTLQDPGWIPLRRVDDFVPDHGHLMHLFVVAPDLNRFWHLHPRQTAPAMFDQQLTALPSGRYEFFADVVHQSGIAETITGAFDAAAESTTTLSGDDSRWSVPSQSRIDQRTAPLEDGGRMVWIGDPQPPKPRQLNLFTFRVEDASGAPATDLELYMGMPGHAVFISRDRQVFAHVHPSGSAPMATLEMTGGSVVPAMPAMPSMTQAGALPSTVSFPYGIPRPGRYCIFVQIKRHGAVETGAFDVDVP